MSGWPTVALGEVVDEARPGFACGEVDPDGVPQFRMNNVTREGALDYTKIRRVPRAKARLDSFALRTGDVLFNATNSPDLVGKTAYFIERDEPTVFSNHFLRLRTGRRLDPGYLTRWIQHEFHRRTFEGLCRQWVNQATVGRDALLKLQLPLPSLPEQRRIAAILDQADALRTKRRDALARLDELTRALFVDMFGALGPNEYGWLTVEFGSLLADGPQNGMYKPSSDYGSGTRILRIDGFHNGVPIAEQSLKRVQIGEAEIAKYSLRPRDIVINRVNSIEHLGKSAIVPALAEKVVFESNMMRVRLDEALIVPDFCLAQLQSDYVRAQILTAAKDAVNQSSINQTDVRSFLVRLPPLARQNEYVHRLDCIRVVERQHRTALAELDALFASLQARAFRGEL